MSTLRGIKRSQLMPVFGGYENETEEDRQEALSSQGRKKQQPQVGLMVGQEDAAADKQSGGGNLW